jgi:hypothetical protein
MEVIAFVRVPKPGNNFSSANFGGTFYFSKMPLEFPSSSPIIKSDQRIECIVDERYEEQT